MPKPRYKTTNWKQYNKALINRGSLTFWIDEEAIRQWKQSKQDKRGRPRQFSDLAITTALMVKRVFSMPLRALQGFIDSVFSLANVPIACPHYSCISRRAKQVEVSFKPKSRRAIQHLAIDATGLKVYGEGEKHGTDGKRRVWRKLHLAVDTSTHEIVAAELSLSNVTDAEVLPNLLKQTRRRIIEISGDGAYDTRDCYEAIRFKRAVPLIPPREGAAFWENGHPRNLAVGCQKLHGSNNKWKKRYGYHKRSLSETAMYRAKQLLGGRLSLRSYNAQVGETYAMIKA
ncbi:IS5 family transposase, partial [Vibrio vulnificus]|nr:IS5 family transposase [Vibrio vulnificus]